MRILDYFKNKHNIPDSISTGSKEMVEFERPRICAFDLAPHFIQQIKNEGFLIFEGSLGIITKVPNNREGRFCPVKLNRNFPKNIHEYDIFLIDLQREDIAEYEEKKQFDELRSQAESQFLGASYPKTKFDPRPLSLRLLKDELKKIKGRSVIVIAFSAANIVEEYEIYKSTLYGPEFVKKEKHNLYSFMNYNPPLEVKRGLDCSVEKIGGDLQNVLMTYIKEAEYNQTFSTNSPWLTKEENEGIRPLIKSLNKDSVSIQFEHRNIITFIFPQFKEKGKFLVDFLKKSAPNVASDIFPHLFQFSWINEPGYWLPNHKALTDEKEKLISEFEETLNNLEYRINQNSLEFSFLHDILTKTDSELVDSLERYLKWLGFNQVINVDSEENKSNSDMEEDLRIEIGNEKIIIEAKGIGGTSTDSACSQVQKIVNRKKTKNPNANIRGIYIVNHQRYKSPIDRMNPPFTENQVKDAIIAQRGLLTTWELFNLEKRIATGVITKREARKQFREIGLITFKPQNLSMLGQPYKVLNGGTVALIKLTGQKIRKGDHIFIHQNGDFFKTEIVRIEKDKLSILEAESGNVGLKLSKEIRKNSTLFRKIDPE